MLKRTTLNSILDLYAIPVLVQLVCTKNSVFGHAQSGM